MNSKTVYEVVKRLIGPIHAIGESHIDEPHFHNLTQMTELVDRLIYDISDTARDRDRQEASMKKIGKHSHKFLMDLKDAIEDNE